MPVGMGNIMRWAGCALFAGVALLPGHVTAATARKLNVVTTIFPLYDWSRQVGGEKADVSLLLPPGVEAHGYAPRPADIVRIGSADVFVWTGKSMEPWADDILKGSETGTRMVLNASQGIEMTTEKDRDHHGGLDPHVWLDPVSAQAMVRSIAEAFAAKDPANGGFYRANADGYVAELKKLDEELRASLDKCKHRTLIYGGHFAFGYFAHRYGLDHVSPYRGFAPDAAPTPRAVAELIGQMKRLGITAIYYEELIDPKVARVIAEETGAKLLLLHGAHNLSKDERDKGLTYLDIMRQNLERLKEGLGYTP